MSFLFDPDDFSDDPYVAGLNQLGHMVFGAALAVFLGFYAAFVVLAWELWQYNKRGALKSDFFADWAFWSYGVILWQWDMFLPSVILLSGAWMGIVWLAKEGKDE